MTPQRGAVGHISSGLNDIRNRSLLPALRICVSGTHATAADRADSGWSRNGGRAGGRGLLDHDGRLARQRMQPFNEFGDATAVREVRLAPGYAEKELDVEIADREQRHLARIHGCSER